MKNGCPKCGDDPRTRRVDATCELQPVVGFKAPCAIKEERRRQREIAEPTSILREIKQDKRNGRWKSHGSTRPRAEAA